jgi:hypothetical protein
MSDLKDETKLGWHFATLRETPMMKRISLLGLFALLLTLTLQQQACAWLNFKFGAGVNWNWQSGGNNFLWGLFRNGQPPGFGSHGDPSCAPCGGFNPFNIGACPQQQQPAWMIPPQQCPPGPWMPQGCGPQGCAPQGSCNPPLFPSFNNGHCLPHEFQFFGQQTAPTNNLGDPRQTVAAYGYQGSQSSNYYPYGSSSYYNSSSGYYPYGSSSYYGNSSGYYPYGSSSYYPTSSSSYYPTSSSSYYPTSSSSYNPYGASSYYSPYGASSSYYNGGYQANPYSCYYNMYAINYGR